METSAVQDSSPLQIPIQVRHERDPYLYFLDISGGSKSFGLTTGEKVRTCSTHIDIAGSTHMYCQRRAVIGSVDLILALSSNGM